MSMFQKRFFAKYMGEYDGNNNAGGGGAGGGDGAQTGAGEEARGLRCEEPSQPGLRAA